MFVGMTATTTQPGDGKKTPQPCQAQQRAHEINRAVMEKRITLDLIRIRNTTCWPLFHEEVVPARDTTAQLILQHIQQQSVTGTIKQ